MKYRIICWNCQSNPKTSLISIHVLQFYPHQPNWNWHWLEEPKKNMGNGWKEPTFCWIALSMAILSGWRLMEVKPSGLTKSRLHGLLVQNQVWVKMREELVDLLEKTPIPMKSNKDGDMVMEQIGMIQVRMMSSSNPLFDFKNLKKINLDLFALQKIFMFEIKFFSTQVTLNIFLICFCSHFKLFFKRVAYIWNLSFSREIA